MTEIQERVLGALRDEGWGMTACEIAEAARVTAPQARKAIGELVSLGLVDRAGVSRTNARCYVIARN